MAEQWIVLGEHVDARGHRQPVGLPMERLKLHMSVLGTTGSGKSTFLRNLVLQVFDQGGTAIVMEPHGDLIYDPQEGILAALSDEQLARVTILDLGGDYPPQMNLLQAGIGGGREAAIEMAMRCIEVVEDAGWKEAIRMRGFIRQALHLLLVTEAEASFVDLDRFFHEPTYRAQRIEAGGRQEAFFDLLRTQRAWQETQERWEADRGGGQSEIAVVERRVGKLLDNALLRDALAMPLLAREQGVNLAALMDDPEPRLILIPLSGLKGAESQRVVAVLFMQLIAAAFLARAEQAREARRQTLVVLDEFAALAGSAVGELVGVLLAQARKFGASLALATQSLSQIPGDVRDELKNNTNHKIILQTRGADDARLAVELLAAEQLARQDVANIAQYHAYARLAGKGTDSTCYFRSLPPLPPLPRAARAGPVRPRRLLPRTPLAEELVALHAQLEAGQTRDVVAHLRGLKDPHWQALVETQVRLGRAVAEALIDNPALEPDPVRRAVRVSQNRHGLPRAFYRAQYQRLFVRERKETPSAI